MLPTFLGGHGGIARSELGIAFAVFARFFALHYQSVGGLVDAEAPLDREKAPPEISDAAVGPVPGAIERRRQGLWRSVAIYGR